MVYIRLLFKSLLNLKVGTSISIITLSLSVFLLIGIGIIQKSARESFSGVVSQTDLIVGARSGPVQLMLYSIFRIGAPTSNILWETYTEIANHEAIDWTIPFSLGDSHKGYRVVGTNKSFYEHYKYRNKRSLSFSEGSLANNVFDVVLGWEVSKKLGYAIGDKIVLTHGIGSASGISDHRDKPFNVVGIIHKTNTPVDRSLYVSLEGIEAIHVDWKTGTQAHPNERTNQAEIHRTDLKPRQITSFLLGTKNRVMSIGLQRVINTYEKEALLAIIPGVTLSEFWQSISYAENGFLVISGIVLLVSLLGIFLNIYASINERKREIAILRSLGIRPSRVFILILSESFMLIMGGIFLGSVLLYVSVFVLQPIIEDASGIFLTISAPGSREILYGLLIISGGVIISLFPALRAYRVSLNQGLMVQR